MKKPRLSESTIAMLEIKGEAEVGKMYYELKDQISPEGKIYTVMERTNLNTGDTDSFAWDYIRHISEKRA